MNVYTLGGYPLEDPAGRWTLDIETGVRIRPARRTAAAVLPGRHGTTHARGETYEPGQIALVPEVTGATHKEFMENLELLTGVTAQTYGLITLDHDLGDGTIRRAEVTFDTSIEPQLITDRVAKLPMAATIPGVFWRDTSTTDATANITNTQATTTLTALAGTTAPITDALLRFQGGFSQATITDPASGDSILIEQTVSSTQYLVVDVANWVARLHNGDSWSTTAGSNVIGSVSSNRGSGPMLALNPDFAAGAGRIRLTVKGVIEETTSPTVTVRARRSFI